jgi:hypothetical protein
MRSGGQSSVVNDSAIHDSARIVVFYSCRTAVLCSGFVRFECTGARRTYFLNVANAT